MCQISKHHVVSCAVEIAEEEDCASAQSVVLGPTCREHEDMIQTLGQPISFAEGDREIDAQELDVRQIPQVTG